MELLSENPISNEDDDAFDFKSIAEGLGKAIYDSTSPPETVGIIGKWGSGKTSLMQLLCNWLIDNGYKTLWFNPWVYKHKEEVWTALIRAILLKIYKTTTKSSLKKSVWAMLKNIGWPTFDESLLTVSGGYAVSDNFGGIGNPQIVHNPIEERFFKKLEDGISNVIQDYVGEKGRLIIFIDDFENGTPERIITILESLKPYWISNLSVIIFSMDEAVIDLGIKERYGSQFNLSGREYIEKQIELPYFLPPIQFKKIQEHFKSEAKGKDLTPQIWKLLQYSFGGNPRRIKRFINGFFKVKSSLNHPEIAKKLGIEIEHDKTGGSEKEIYNTDQLFYLAKVLVIKQSYPEFYEYIHKNPSGWARYEKIIQAKRQFKLDELKAQGISTRELSKEDILKRYPEVTEFWLNRYLRVVMQQTSGNDFPAPLSVYALKRILRFMDTIQL